MLRRSAQIILARIWFVVVVILTLEFSNPLSGAETHRVGDSDGFRRAVSAAKPGDTILLAEGEYSASFHFRGIHGSAREPIVIAAADTTKPPRFTNKTAPLHFSSVSHIELRGLVIAGVAGNGLNIDDSGDAKTPSHHLSMIKLAVRDIGPQGNRDGIKLSGLDDFRIEECTVERWGSDGSGIDMVGCHRGTVENCIFRKGGSNGVQTKGASLDIVIRKCRFEDAGRRAVNLGGSTGDDYFRPPLASFPDNGRYEAKNILVEGCTFTGGDAAVAFVGVDGAVVRFNTIYRPERYVIRILQEKTAAGFVPCRDGNFENNVVVFQAASTSVRTLRPRRFGSPAISGSVKMCPSGVDRVYR